MYVTPQLLEKSQVNMRYCFYLQRTDNAIQQETKVTHPRQNVKHALTEGERRHLQDNRRLRLTVSGE